MFEQRLGRAKVVFYSGEAGDERPNVAFVLNCRDRKPQHMNLGFRPREGVMQFIESWRQIPFQGCGPIGCPLEYCPTSKLGQSPAG